MYAVIIGRLDKTGERFIANSFEGDAEILQALMSKNCVGQRVVVGSTGKGNRVALSKASLLAQMPLRSKLCLMAMSFAQRCATVILK